MSAQFSLVDSLSLSDLRVFIGRAGRIEQAPVRLVADGSVLAVYVAVLHPAGLLDASPTVLGLRTFALARDDRFDLMVDSRLLLERVEQASGAATAAEAGSDVAATVVVPPTTGGVSWAAISPPRGGWLSLGRADDLVLESAARSGIDEVAKAVPTGTGEQIVRRVRSEVWSRTVDGTTDVPTGGAFAALSLGFLGDVGVDVYRAGSWTRLSTPRGHVLVKRRSALGPS